MFEFCVQMLYKCQLVACRNAYALHVALEAIG
jgi:hypothetical protein